MFSPSFSPHDPNELFASCDMSELFHTDNLGVSWAPVHFSEAQGNRSSKVQFTENPNVLYVIDHTDETPQANRSTDGGQTWRPLASDPTDGGTYTLLVDPQNGQRILVSDYATLYFSGDGGASFASVVNNNDGNGIHVAGAFFDGNMIYAGTSAGLYVSSNGGASFAHSAATGMPSDQRMISFSGGRSGATTRFFALTAEPGDVYGGVGVEDFFFTHQEMFTLDAGAEAWVARNAGLPMTPDGEGDGLALVAGALDDPDVAYASGQSGIEEPIIFKTTNGGQSWQSVLFTEDNANAITGWAGAGGDRGWSYGGGTVGLGVAPYNADYVAFTDYGFLHLSTDGGNTWRQTYVASSDQNALGERTPKGRSYHGVGLENTSCWNLTWSDPQNVWGCFTDIRGIRSTDGGDSWSFDYTGHTENTAYHSVRATSGRLYMATSTVHDLYQSTYLTDARIDGGDGRVLYSDDLGQTWQVLHDFNHPVIWLALDPNAANTLYASVVHGGEGGIYRSTNIDQAGASSWTKLTPPPRTQGHPFNIRVLDDGTLVCTYSGRRGSAGFTDSSGVFASTNGGTSWADRSHANMHYWVKDVVIDPNDAQQNTWYACVWSGYGGPLETNNEAGGLYRTTDRGQNWTRINSLYRVSSAGINPANDEEMYVTTEMEGLWQTSNLSAPSPTFERVEDYPFRQPERVFFNPYNSEVWVTSFGNGIRIFGPTP